MTRYLYPGGEVMWVDGGADDAYLAPNQAFTVWDARTGGNEVSADMMAPDGVTQATLEATSDGQRPDLRGPDGWETHLWLDAGAPLRFAMAPVEKLDEIITDWEAGGGTPASDHGSLSGLSDDDHPIYHNDTRGDARYYTKAQTDTALSVAASAQSTNDRNRANHTGTQAITSITDLENRLNGVIINTVTTSYVLVLADAGKLVRTNSATANNLTVPPNSSVAFPIGTIVNFTQLNTGLTTVVPGSGVTILSRNNLLNSAGRYAGWTLTKTDTNEWSLVGDLA
jgi:hypothetical protein